MSNQHTIQFRSIIAQCLTSALFLAVFTVITDMNLFDHMMKTVWAEEPASGIPDAASGLHVIAGSTVSLQPAETTVRIGVLAHKGIDTCRQMWQPTMDYLTQALPGRSFVLVPMKYYEIKPAVRARSIDFLICNPAIAVNLEVKYGITRMLTMRNLIGTQSVSEYGGVVFCRNDHTNLQSLRDIRGHVLAAADRMSFGGWYMALREFRAESIDPLRECSRVLFLDTHPRVVRAVLSGEADIGIVRTDTIERMAAGSEIRMEDIRVIPSRAASKESSTFPCIHSTRLYPEWPVSKLCGTDGELARRLTMILLGMSAGSPAATAAEISGWDVCLNDNSVHDCLRELQMPPYEYYGQITWLGIWRQHEMWIIAVILLIAALLGALLLLHWRQLAVKRVSNQNRLLLASAGEGICGTDIHGITTFVNPAASIILEYPADELIGRNLHDLTHHTKPDGQPYPLHECPIYMACKDGTIHQGSDEFFFRSDGSAIPIMYFSRPIIDRGQITGAVVCFQKITDSRRAE